MEQYNQASEESKQRAGESAWEDCGCEYKPKLQVGLQYWNQTQLIILSISQVFKNPVLAPDKF